MKKTIFGYNDYKSYLKALIASQPKGGRGVRLALAQTLRCPVSHISQVLKGSSHFSLEQAERVNIHFGHTDDEANFFLLLLQFGRAGSSELKKRLQKQVGGVLEKRKIHGVFGVKMPLTFEQQTEFYSSWLYSAIHVLISVEGLQTKEALADYLKLPLKRVAELLETLVSMGMVVPTEGGRFTYGPTHIFLTGDSPLRSKLHTNWRMQAIRALDRLDVVENMHYSSAISVSEADFLKIKNILIDSAQDIKKIITDSKPEGAFCFSMDLFRL